MREFKGTPGPWEVDINLTDTTEIAGIGTRYKTVCSLSAYEHRCCSIDETNANAKLIASAPELLESLQDLMSSIGGGKKYCAHDFHCNCAWDKAKLAINKALNIQKA